MPQEGWGPGPEPSPAIPTATQLLPLSASFHITVSEPSLPQMQSTASASKALSVPAGPCKHPPCPEPPASPALEHGHAPGVPVRLGARHCPCPARTTEERDKRRAPAVQTKRQE